MINFKVVSSKCSLTSFLPYPLTEILSFIQESLNYVEYYQVEEKTSTGNDFEWSLSSQDLQSLSISATYNDDDLANLEPSLGEFLPGNLLTTETLILNQSLAAVNDFSSHTPNDQITSQSRRPASSSPSRYHYTAVDSDNIPDPRSTPKTFYIQKLAELSVSLYKNALNFPSELSTQPPSKTEPSRSTIFETFPYDKTLHLMQDLLEVLTNLCLNHEESTSTLPTSNPTHLQPPEGFNAVVVYHGNQTPQSSSRSTSLPMSSLDDATALLIISCYARLLDILETMFTHTEEQMKTCTSPDSQHAPLTWFLPQVQIGSFTLTSALVQPMQALLVVQVMAELFSQVRQIMDRINPEVQNQGEFANMRGPADWWRQNLGSKPMTEVVRDRAEKLGNQISRVRGNLLQEC